MQGLCLLYILSYLSVKYTGQVPNGTKLLLNIFILLYMCLGENSNFLCLQAFGLTPKMGCPRLSTRSSIAVAR